MVKNCWENVMAVSAPESKSGTWSVTLRMLRRFLPGEVRGLVGGMLVIIATSITALLQPWPLKLVIDSVVGRATAPHVVLSVVEPVARFLSVDPGFGL